MKWWDPHTKKLKYFLSAKFDEYNNKFGKGWSPGSQIMTRTNIYTFLTFKIDPSNHPFGNMIYLKSMLIYHQEVLLLVSMKNNVNIITSHLSPSQPKTANGIMPPQKETVLMSLSLALTEKNQQQSNKLWKLYQVNN